MMASTLFLALKRRRLLTAPLLILLLFALYQYLYGDVTDIASRLSLSKTKEQWLLAATVEKSDGTKQIDWSKLPEHYPVKKPLVDVPTTTGRGGIPQIQAQLFPKKDDSGRNLQQQRLLAVKNAFRHAWDGYRNHAWLRDEVGPLSGGYQDNFGGWGATLVDSLGTLWIMDMEMEFAQAVMAVNEIDFTTCALEELNVFETTIRYLGGLLSAYDLCEGRYPQLLNKAIELGEMLYHAFDTPNRMPITRWNFKAALEGVKQEAGDFVLVAEIGSLSLEFTRLSQVTGDPKFYSAVAEIMDVFLDQQNKTHLPGMWPVAVNARSTDFTEHNSFTIGGMADSLYEYFPKQHLLLNGATSQYQTLYETAMKPIYEYIFYRPMTQDHHDILIPGQVSSKSAALTQMVLEPQAQHLACFAGGMVGLSAKIFNREADLKTARQLVEGCLWGYESFPVGIMPEIFHTVRCPTKEDCEWDEERWHAEVLAGHPQYDDVEEIIKGMRLPPGVRNVDDARYILRPEAIESVFYLYRITGDTKLQDRAWRMFENIVHHTKTDIAHAALDDVTVERPPKVDRMESFWLAETLRYFYLIFADEDVISLDEWVLNTEAHPLLRPK